LSLNQQKLLVIAEPIACLLIFNIYSKNIVLYVVLKNTQEENKLHIFTKPLKRNAQKNISLSLTFMRDDLNCWMLGSRNIL